MKLRIIVSSHLVIAFFTCCDFHQTLITPVDELGTKEYTISGYSDLIVSHAFKVQVNLSDSEESITIEANENLLEYVKVLKDGYALHIGLDNNILVKGRATLRAHITTKALNSFSGSGASRITVEDILKETDVAIDLSGASYFTGEVHSEELLADLSGASNINVSGYAEECSVSASGASEFKDYTFETNYFYGDLSGASNAYITINQEISIEASGASKLYYKGHASPISQDLSGGSKIIKTE